MSRRDTCRWFGRAPWIIVAAVLPTMTDGTRACAEEMVTPLLAGVSIGTPAARPPPPGLYATTTTLYLKGVQRDGQGRATNLSFHELEISQSFLLATDIRILGGRWSALVAQPAKATSATTPPTELRQLGAYNTIVSPGSLSWDLGRGLFASLGTTFYLPDGTYSLRGPKIANGFFTYEQNIAIAYRTGDYAFIANGALDLNAVNPASDYRSGHVLGIDVTATRSFGKLSVGLGGYFVEQLSDDRLHGRTLAASPLNGRGNRWRELALGPYAAYDFGAFQLAAWFTQDLYARNTVEAGTGWLRVSFPIGRTANAGS